MAGINDYSNTPSLNTTINTIDVDEGCNPANINDAIRQLMADIADVDDGVVPLQTPDINGGTIDGASLGASSPITSATISGDLTVDTNTLYVDSTNNRVGIGTTSPAAKLNIQATAATSGEDLIKLINGADAAELVIDTGSNTVNFNLGASDVLKVIGGSGASGSTIPSPGTFVVENNNEASIAVLTPDAYTSYIRLGHTSDPSACKWSFDPSTDAMEIGTTTTSGYVGFLAGNATEAIRLASSGNVGIGETAPAQRVHIKNTGTGSVRMRIENDEGYGEVSTDGNAIQLRTQSGIVFESYDNDYTAIRDGNAVERMRIDSSGHAIIPNGVTLGTATGTYSAANTIDDYEEGTWTPSFQFSSAQPTAGATTGTGYYTKVGNMVTIWGAVTNANVTGASGDVRIRDLPFTSKTASGLAGWVGSMSVSSMTFTGYVNCDVNQGSNYIRPLENISGSARDILNVGNCTHGATDVYFCVNYQVT